MRALTLKETAKVAGGLQPKPPIDGGGGGGGVVNLPPIIVHPDPVSGGGGGGGGGQPPSDGSGSDPSIPHGGGSSGSSNHNGSSQHAWLTQYFDLDFIHNHENTYNGILTPNVPSSGSSGVTVGYGVDLGALDNQTLDLYVSSYGLDHSFIDKLRPYLGMQKDQASNFLRDHPLSFTESDRSSLNAISDVKYQDSLAHLDTDFYNATAALGHGAFINQLPREAATAIADVAIQYGNYRIEHTDFWNQVTHFQWSTAHANLMDYQDPYGPRRQDDGGQLQDAINHGLHDGSWQIGQ